MKRIVFAAGLLLLVGAGCLGEGEITPTTPTDTTNQAMEEAQEALPTADAETSVEILSDDMVVEEEDEASKPPSEESEELSVKRVNMESGNFFFEPASIAVEAGQEVEITFTNNEGFHTFVIDEIGLKETVAEGETIRFTAPEKGGTYAFYCDVGRHREFGMEGTLHVKEL